MYNTLTKEEFKHSGITLSEYHQMDIAEAEKLADEISKFYPAEVIYSYSLGDKEQKYFENSYIQLMHPYLNIRVSKYKDKFSFYAWDLHDLTNTSDYDRRKASEEIGGEPQKIGVLTQKKILAWVGYYEKLYKILKELDDRNADKKQKFLDEIKYLPVHWYDKDRKDKGWIERNGIQIAFTMEATYVSCQLSIHHSAKNDLETFLKLSDNKF